MKRVKLATLCITTLFMASITYFVSCTHEDEKIDLYNPKTDTVTIGINSNDKELIAEKVTTIPAIDGTIESLWDNRPELVVRAVVPDPGDNVFRGYEGYAIDVRMRALYDAEYIYFLVEWNDNTVSQLRNPWYFDPVSKRWKQESNKPTFNAQGIKTREAFYEDKVAFLWNINNSVADWNTKTCYTSCHTDLGAANAFARHYTNSATEKIDMWHWKFVRDNHHNHMDDQYQDNTQPNGRKSDAGAQGYTDNIQKLTITGDTTKVSVPKYVIPSRTFYNWITKAEIDNGTAKEITAVDANGVLTYSGGTIDPTDVDYMRVGASVGAKAPPSVYTSMYDGSRGDITAFGKHTGNKWILEIKRKLKTADAEKDVDFSSLADQYFGIGVFENASYAHAIKPGNILKFKK